ncbi:hypothetical protein [Natronorubrum tibetense]|uniref:Uncharacterized protein n=1 Tax=Natronorubrum tibetense GA33 TaxID=1114856 RepID=L9W7G0_9EURY|nr:hypothetical protein [Natronorubrum tibetense]ELY45420.1 hypothetical protein C496_03328 [Natronorubrum tibetense GA33]
METIHGFDTLGADVSLEVNATVVDEVAVDEDGEVTLAWGTTPGDAGDRTITVTASEWLSAPSDSEAITIDAEPETLSVDVSGTTASGETELRDTGNPNAQTYTVAVTVWDGESEATRTETLEYAG